MKNYHSRIRAEAGVLYAAAHPEVRLEDIGIALGFKVGRSAKSMMSLFITDAGITRPRGAGSAAYDKKDMFRGSKLDEHVSEIKKMLAEDVPYGEMAKVLNCHTSLVSVYCRNKLGVKRGYGWGCGGSEARIKDAEIIAFMQANPDMPIRTVATHFGYKGSGGWYRRVSKLMQKENT